MEPDLPSERVFEGVHARMRILRARPGVVLVVIEGTDVGELQRAPLSLLDRILAEDASIELFIDARDARTASIAVSHDWALWLRKQRARLPRVHMLTATRFVRITAEHVRRFAQIEDAMRITGDAPAFERLLETSIARA